MREARRYYVRTDLLAKNALLSTELVRRSGPNAEAPKILKALIADAAETLFASERDRKIQRVLDLTYFNPAPKQEAAAERLGLSFGTYRRSLAAGVDRLTEWLWEREQGLEAAEAKPSGSARDDATDTLPAARPRLSIVVLPFLNLSREAGADYLVDGIVDALITDLSSCLPGSFVISRSTSFTYKDRSVPIRQVGEELGVLYVIEGSVLVDRGRLRVNVQLIDAETDVHLWAERFDKERTEMLQVQDEIVGRLSRSVGIQLVRTEAVRGNPKGEGWGVVDLVMRARALMQLGDDAAAVTVLSQAMDSNPGYLRGRALLAAAQALAGNVEAAQRRLEEYRRLEPDMTVRRFAEQRSSVPPNAVSEAYRRESERILEGLRRAGMPDGSRT